MTDVFNPIEGVTLRRLRGQTYVVLYPYRMGNPTIEEVAEVFHLQPEEVFEALLLLKNRDAVRQLYMDYVHKLDDSWPGWRVARLKLREYGRNTTSAEFWSVYPTYFRWELRLKEDQYVLIPLSKDFRRLLREAAARRHREARLEMLKPTFADLEEQIKKIRFVALDLDTKIGMLKKVYTDFCEQEIRILSALDGMINALLEYPKEPSSVDFDDRREMKQLQSELSKLIEKAYRHMVEDPPESLVGPNLVEDRDRLSQELLELLKDAELFQNVEVVLKNIEIVPVDLWHRMWDSIYLAAHVLCSSPVADRFLSEQIDPLIDHVASQECDTSDLNAKDPNLLSAIRNAPSPPEKTDNIWILLTQTGAGTSLSVGNLPGPSTLVVTLVRDLAPKIMARAIQTGASTKYHILGKLCRVLIRYGSRFTPKAIRSEYNQVLIRAIEAGDLQIIKRHKAWANKFMAGPGWGAGLAVVHLCMLIYAIQNTEEDTLTYWASIFSSGSGFALSVGVALQRYSKLAKLKIVQGRLGVFLGSIGGVASAVAGAEMVVEEWETNDMEGVAVGGMLAVSGVIGVAEAMIAAGIATAPEGVGIFLAILGTLLGLGAIIWGTIREWVKTGSELVFEGLLNHFGTLYRFERAIMEVKELEDAFEKVQSYHHGVSFWDVSAARIPELHDLGFPPEHIARIVDEDETVIIPTLVSAGRTVEA